ncbi:MAG: NusG domain II-containing protein [Acidobacteria bacterium]|nr:NusG domain II-containing protein [Acidobacteriota bacterium]MCG2814671.1 NusG domain II-containing protein [Candidatus Aminicenantes bacterium]
MERRDFFKTILTTSLLTPLLLESKSTQNELELYLLSDDPHHSLPSLLKGTGFGGAKTYDFNGFHPKRLEISGMLERSGWTSARSGRASLLLSHRRLQKKAEPSFTLVRNGKILDARAGELESLWRSLRQNAPLTFSLTSASLHSASSRISAGKTALCTIDGRQAARLNLRKNGSRTFATSNGRVSVKVESGAVRIEESSCKNHICVHSFPVSLEGERIICAPNRFMIAVEGGRTVDTIIG